MIKLVVKAAIPEGGTKDFSYEFDQPVVTMGRLKENDIQLPVSTVSGFHAQILREENNYYLLDRGSINGTYLNDQRLVAGDKKLLNDGDVIKVQSFEIYFSSGITMMNIDSGATVQVARQMVMEVLGSWKTNVAEKPRIIVMGGPYNGKQFDLTEGKTLTIGRVAECDLMIDHPSVSRKHAEISMSWSGAFIKDNKSANGVFVNDQRVAGSQKLRDRDEVRLGQQTSSEPVILVFSNPAEALLSKIEDMQITDSHAGQLNSKEVTDAADKEGQKMAAEGAEGAEGESPAAPASAESGGPSEAAAEAAPVAYVPEEASGKSGMTLIMLIGLAAVGLALVGFLFFFLLGLGKSTPLSLSVQPNRGGAGDSITITGDLHPEKVVSVTVSDKPAKILKSIEGSVQIEIPEIPELDSPQSSGDIVLKGKKKEIGRVPFTLLLLPRVRGVTPRSGLVGTEVRIQTNMPGQQPTVYFGQNPAGFKAKTDREVVVIVPRPTEIVPASGLKVPITVKIGENVSKNNIDFTMFPAPVSAEEKFILTFSAKPFSQSLGFNEYSIETNLGPLLLMVSKGAFTSSRERAEEGARNLNAAVDFFKQNADAEVTLVKEGDGYGLYAETSAGAKLSLVRVFPDDALAYGKVNGRTVAPADLADWWQMILDSYYSVFVQVQSPEDSGILSAGGAIFQRIFSFYPVGNDQEGKYYKKDFASTLPGDQKDKLLALSFGLPSNIASVAGKWTGRMTNNLYSNISQQDLEIVINLNQRGDVLSGTAEMNWKIVIGGGDNSFQNVAFKKLGTFNLFGGYHKTKALPVEFSFNEKQGRRLDFVGKVENDILFGKFSVSSTGNEGDWSVKLQK